MRIATRTLLLLVFGNASLTPSQAQLAGSEAIQLQQLIRTSEEQLKSIQELLKVSRQDAKTLEAANKSLAALSAGLDRSIEKFQGTKAYEQALLLLQAEDLNERAAHKRDPQKQNERVLRFQQETLQANRENLKRVQELEQDLRTAGPAFVPKIQSQAELGHWQTSARLSAQLSEVLTALNGLREDLNGRGQSGLEVLLEGAEMQNRKLKEATAHAKQ